MENIMSPNDAWKAIWKPEIDEIAKASRSIAPWAYYTAPHILRS